MKDTLNIYKDAQDINQLCAAFHNNPTHCIASLDQKLSAHRDELCNEFSQKKSFNSLCENENFSEIASATYHCRLTI